MLEMYTGGIQLIQENFKKAFDSPMGIFCHAVVTGIIGVVILTAFFSMLLAPATLVKALPFFVAFNAAASAYGIVDKGGSESCNIALCLALITVVFAITEGALSTVLLPWDSATAGVHLIIGGFSALVFSFLGVRLAEKIQKNDAHQH